MVLVATMTKGEVLEVCGKLVAPFGHPEEEL
jgi:hypothetical protein